MSNQKSNLPNVAAGIPAKITFIYALLGGAWILFSDRLLALIITDLGMLTRLQTFKGWFYVLVTAGVLYYLIGKNVHALEVSRKALQASNQNLEAANQELLAADEELRQQYELLLEARENQKQAEETINYQAYYDSLTNLPNRYLFNDRLTSAIAHANKKNEYLALFLVNLDRFKQINSSLGHTVGDQLLVEAAGRLIACAGKGTTVARIAGDEFALILSHLSGAGALAAEAEKISQAFQPVWKIAHHELHLSACLGITVYPTDGSDAQTLLQNAQTALNRAKEQDNYNCQFYTYAMHSHFSQRLHLENELRQAMVKHSFLVYYQPIVSLHTGTIVGLEALVRWQHPTRGLLSPDKFIDLAEECNLIFPLGQFVLQTACSQVTTWHQAGFPDLFISVNLSARQFKGANLVSNIVQTLQETELQPNRLLLEITEGTAISDIDFTISTLNELRQMGVRIAMDDFGTGYSSLSYLKILPIDVLKIDRSFIKDITTNQASKAIAAAIMSLSNNLSIKVTAEGVETFEQLDYLKNLSCDKAQGYLFSKPLPANELAALLNYNVTMAKASSPEEN